MTTHKSIGGRPDEEYLVGGTDSETQYSPSMNEQTLKRSAGVRTPQAKVLEEACAANTGCSDRLRLQERRAGFT